MTFIMLYCHINLKDSDDIILYQNIKNKMMPKFGLAEYLK